ncbi:MAG: CPBP family intramembrane metalloprotease [Cytophagia bacterium]|nr:MAG: CPBP family intramembrane metalloprotease [Cytophagales bacterium]TAG38097.1 MAG: CPBP family intramembrane metalloprotease [Cytophagia bacterium]TAG79528.1 MAG: CPBP family intramembrane metalloprotease [Cytophagales bacterium]
MILFLNDIFLFAKTGKIEKVSWNSFEFFKAFVLSLIMSYMVFILIIAIMQGILYYLNLPPPINNSALFFKNKTFAYKLSTVGLIGPILEELSFRLLLKYQPVNFIIFLFASTLNVDIIKNFSIVCIVSLYAFLGLVIHQFLSIHKCTDNLIRKIFETYPRLILYFSITLFAIIHLFNYNLSSIPTLLIPFIILPQFFDAFILSYFRVSFGIIASISLHSVHNLLLIFISHLNN